MQLKNAEKVTLTAPPGGVLKSIKIQVTIEPADGSVLIYAAPNYDQPTEVSGPEQVLDLVTTEPEIYVQRTRGAESYQIQTLGYVDDLGR